MNMLDDAIKAQLKAYLEKVVYPIEIIANVDGSEQSREVLALVQDIAGLSDKVSWRETSDSALRTPSFAINRIGSDMKIRFAGLPMGHEFTSLILALLQAGGHPAKEEAELLEQIKSLDGEYNFVTYISLSCHNCPDIVQALNLMAVLNPKVSATMVDGGMFQDEVDEKKIMAVPTIYLNGEHFSQGRMSLAEIVGKLDTKSAERDAAKLSAKEAFDVLVVGGGPAGAAAAIYAARKGIRTGVVAERFGGQVMDTLGIENFISVDYTEGPKLVAAMENHVKMYDVDIMNLQRVAGVTPAAKPGGLVEVKLENGGVLKSRSVIVATGARWRELGVPGEREFRGHGVAYCPHCDGPLFKGKPVAVVGGGNSGVEAAIDLAGIVGSVVVLEFAPQLKADAVLQKKLFSLPNVKVITNAQTTEVTGADGKVNGLVYKDRTTSTEHTLALDGVFVQIGLLPNSDFLKGSVSLSRFGEVEVDAKGQTSGTGVFAAGDVTTVPYKQIIIAMGEGSKAALAAFDYLIRSSVDDESSVAKAA
jgi:alkyl hydroperoxide reductase subunit F